MKNILQQLTSSFDGHPWYGTSFMDIVDRIEFDQVNLVPDNGSNSIVRLMSHIIAWRIFIIKKLQGDADFDIVLNTKEDWPDASINTPEDWSSLKGDLSATQVKIVKLLEGLPESFDMEDLVPGKQADPNYTYRYMLTGMIQHDTYHLGQIALTWKLVREG